MQSAARDRLESAVKTEPEYVDDNSPAKKREVRGWSLGKRALLSGVSKSTLSRWESGKTVPRGGELDAMLRALDTPSRSLILTALSPLLPGATAPTPLKIGSSGIPRGDLIRILRMRQGLT